MPELMLPGDTGLLLPTKLLPKVEMGSGTKGPETAMGAISGFASDLTWSMIIVTMACAVMVVVSAMKGVRRFSFALTYTNLWYIFGKRGRLRVRVHSFTSTNGSNCFVTTSGEFSAELVKEEEELEKQLDLGFDRKANDVKGPCAGRAGCVVGTEMVFIYNDRTSVFTAGSLAAGFPQRKSYLEALCTPVSARSKSEKLSHSARAVRAAGELLEWQQGVLGTGEWSRDQFRTRKSLVSDWTVESREPLEASRCQSGPFPHIQRRSVVLSPVKSDYSWDSVLKLRLVEAEEGRRPLTTLGKKIVYPSAVVAGATHTATLRNNVVKLWDNSTRRSVATLPVSTSNNVLSSFDVDWEKDTVVFGSSIGELSLWDFERAKCVTSLRAHAGSISSLQFNAADQVEQDGLVLTAGKSSEESGSCLSLWDSRAFNAAAVRSGVGRFSSVDDLKFKDYEVVAKDENSRISMYDVRMLNFSPVLIVSTGEVRSVGCQGCAQFEQSGLEEEWWDASAVYESSDEDADFEDDWGMVDQETGKSPSVLTRCFNALSSALSR